MSLTGRPVAECLGPHKRVVADVAAGSVERTRLRFSPSARPATPGQRPPEAPMGVFVDSVERRKDRRSR